MRRLLKRGYGARGQAQTPNHQGGREGHAVERTGGESYKLMPPFSRIGIALLVGGDDRNPRGEARQRLLEVRGVEGIGRGIHQLIV